MMKKLIYRTLVLGALAIFVTSCSYTHHLMKEPNVRVELNRDDFTLSDQLTADAKSTKVFGIDWARLFKSKAGDINAPTVSLINVANIPVIGNVVVDRTANYALYELMNTNQGYDVVIYPQYETVKKSYIIFSKTTVKVTARLGKLK